MIRSGRRKLMIPNSAFLTREFVIVEEEEEDARGAHSHHEHNGMHVNGTRQPHNGVGTAAPNGVTPNGTPVMAKQGDTPSAETL